VPFQLWIVVAVLAAASPSFAKEAAPKGAVHKWTEKAEPAVVPVGEPEIVPRSALSSDFPMIDTSSPAPPAAVQGEAVPARRGDSKRGVEDASDGEQIAAVVEPPAAVRSPVILESPDVVEAPAVVESPDTDVVPAAIVEQPPSAHTPEAETAEAPAGEEADLTPPPAPKRLPVAATPRIPSGAAEKAAARAYLAAMQARPDPYQIGSTRRSPDDGNAASSLATPDSGVLPAKIIDVPAAKPYGAPTARTADRETLMREFPDELVEKMWLQDWTDIERAYQFGQLVDVPSDPDGRGIVLRLEGGSRIGELVDDAYRQSLLCRLTKPALGLLYRIASRLRQIEGPDYVPLEITSLVRTWDYQLRLSDVNPNADRTRDGVPPTHVLGMAFDIARTQMSFERQQRIEALFAEMTEAGELAYYKEGSSNGLMHYHVMALPSAETQLARYFERDSYVREQASAGTGERARLPDAPCVMFGSSLEPFSAICSCELPLEVSASFGNAPSAPISR
jgi:hypothetical protein